MIDIDGVLADMSAHDSVLTDNEIDPAQRWREFFAHVPDAAVSFRGRLHSHQVFQARLKLPSEDFRSEVVFTNSASGTGRTPTSGRTSDARGCPSALVYAKLAALRVPESSRRDGNGRSIFIRLVDSHIRPRSIR